MANQLTKQVMAMIVARCEGYEPMKSQSEVSVAKQGAAGENNALNRREEALLSQIIHRNIQKDAPPKTHYETQREAVKKSVQKPVSLTKNGVVSLDALIREIKK
jgi:hypothetical protein